MIYGILGDVHNKVDRLQSVIDSRPEVDHWVLLGDFWDDFGDDIANSLHTAKKVKEWLYNPKITCLLGNHDVSYGWGKFNPNHYCSGFTGDKSQAIHSILTWEDWKRFKVGYWVFDWLITHAGLDSHYICTDDSAMAPIKQANCLLDMVECSLMTLPHSGRTTLLGAGCSRGGNQYKGGITWLDWDEFDVPEGFNQIVGHTQQAKPVRKISNSGKYTAWNIDTSLAHYALLKDGELVVHQI